MRKSSSSLLDVDDAQRNFSINIRLLSKWIFTRGLIHSPRSLYEVALSKSHIYCAPKFNEVMKRIRRLTADFVLPTLHCARTISQFDTQSSRTSERHSQLYIFFIYLYDSKITIYKVNLKTQSKPNNWMHITAISLVPNQINCTFHMNPMKHLSIIHSWFFLFNIVRIISCTHAKRKQIATYLKSF